MKRKRKFEQIVSDSKTGPGKKQRSTSLCCRKKSNMASNKGDEEDSISDSELGVNLDSEG